MNELTFRLLQALGVFLFILGLGGLFVGLAELPGGSVDPVTGEDTRLFLPVAEWGSDQYLAAAAILVICVLGALAWANTDAFVDWLIRRTEGSVLEEPQPSNPEPTEPRRTRVRDPRDLGNRWT